MCTGNYRIANLKIILKHKRKIKVKIFYFKRKVLIHKMTNNYKYYKSKNFKLNKINNNLIQFAKVIRID